MPGNPIPPPLVPARKICGYKFVLARKVVEERAFGNAGFLDDPVDPHSVDSLCVEQPVRCIEEALACGNPGQVMPSFYQTDLSKFALT